MRGHRVHSCPGQGEKERRERVLVGSEVQSSAGEGGVWVPPAGLSRYNPAWM